MKTYYELARVRGFLCECDCGEYSNDRHHCLIHQVKEGGKSKYPVLDDERNLVLVVHHEHVDLKKFDNLEWRKKFWKIQCLRYGEAAMLEWVAAVRSTTKLHKSRFDFLPDRLPILTPSGELRITEE